MTHGEQHLERAFDARFGASEKTKRDIAYRLRDIGDQITALFRSDFPVRYLAQDLFNARLPNFGQTLCEADDRGLLRDLPGATKAIWNLPAVLYDMEMIAAARNLACDGASDEKDVGEICRTLDARLREEGVHPDQVPQQKRKWSSLSSQQQSVVYANSGVRAIRFWLIPSFLQRFRPDASDVFFSFIGEAGSERDHQHWARPDWMDSPLGQQSTDAEKRALYHSSFEVLQAAAHLVANLLGAELPEQHEQARLIVDERNQRMKLDDTIADLTQHETIILAELVLAHGHPSSLRNISNLHHIQRPDRILL